MAADSPGLNVLADNDRYREIFDSAPVSLWDEDFSGVAAFLDELRRQGVGEIDHVEQQPRVIAPRLRRIAEPPRQSRLDPTLPGPARTAAITSGEGVARYEGHARFLPATAVDLSPVSAVPG